ncbi:MAG: nodulation protein NfeD [Hyphomicrobiales bacterium]|nr:nodulation protein NfeD [Hyphomicrobiales bacterium]
MLAGHAGGQSSEESAGQTGAQPGAPVMQIDIEGAIGPAAADFVARSLTKAATSGAPFVIIRLDTPGGLLTSTREIIQSILGSAVPVICYVAPSGAHAASAGTFILYACHVAAMAPGTNIGAATPVQIGAPGMPGPQSDDKEKGKKEDGKDGEKNADQREKPDLSDKAVNDAVAYIRSLAQLRGRNAEWAEKAVTEAASLSADDALQLNVIELTATDRADLLAKLDGREVTVQGRTRSLDTKDVTVAVSEPDWRTQLLAIITDPNVASILMMIGIYGILLEFYSPGLVGPGVIGAICLLLALYAFHVLPVDYSGLALMILGVALMVAEAFAPSFGILGLGGIAAFVIGSVMLIDSDVPGYGVDWRLVGGVGAAAGATFAIMTWAVMRARRRPVVSGLEQMIDSQGPVLRWSDGEGAVRVHGEVWRARSESALRPGEIIRVRRVDGLTLDVEPLDVEPLGGAAPKVDSPSAKSTLPRR